MKTFYEIFSYASLIALLLMVIISLGALLKASIKESRELDEDILRRKTKASQKEKALVHP